MHVLIHTHAHAYAHTRALCRTILLSRIMFYVLCLQQIVNTVFSLPVIALVFQNILGYSHNCFQLLIFLGTNVL